jgi:hypothetical protein
MITGLSLPDPPADARRPPSAWARRRSSTSFPPVEARCLSSHMIAEPIADAWSIWLQRELKWLGTRTTNWPRFNFEKMDAPVRTPRASGGARPAAREWTRLSRVAATLGSAQSPCLTRCYV